MRRFDEHQTIIHSATGKFILYMLPHDMAQSTGKSMTAHPSVHIAGALSLLIFSAPSAVAQNTAPAAQWQIGPIIRGQNYSVGMPLTPRPTRNGWSFDFPNPDADAGHVHYVTFRNGSLAGKSSIILRYRIEGARGVRFAPQEQPEMPAKISLYFQQRGDTWTAKGRYQYYRWYSPAQTMRAVAPGEYEMKVSLDDPRWISVLGQPSGKNTEAFVDAKRYAETVGIVFGSDAARGHGVYATGPARFTLLEFQIL